MDTPVSGQRNTIKVSSMLKPDFGLKKNKKKLVTPITIIKAKLKKKV